MWSDFEEVVKKKACKLACLQAICGGELGIRTLGSFWEHDISSVAPSTSRTTLRICDSVQFKNFSQELTERTTKYLIFEPSKNSAFMGKPRGANCQPFEKFRVVLVMTTSIHLHLYYSLL